MEAFTHSTKGHYVQDSYYPYVNLFILPVTGRSVIYEKDKVKNIAMVHSSSNEKKKCEPYTVAKMLWLSQGSWKPVMKNLMEKTIV